MSESTNEEDILLRYERAKSIHQSSYKNGQYRQALVRNSVVYPTWIDTQNRFWYVRTEKEGKSFRLVDAEAGTNEPVLDHDRLANALSAASGHSVAGRDLPIALTDLSDAPKQVMFEAFGESWRYNDDQGVCQTITRTKLPGKVSPDGKKSVYAKAHNIWLVDQDGEGRLTSDGAPGYSYATPPGRATLLGGFGEWDDVNEVAGFEGAWSPDSRFFFTFCTDERSVRSFPVIKYCQDGEDIYPAATSCNYGLPGDENIASYQMVIIDTHTGKMHRASHRPVDDAVMWSGMFSGGRAWWGADSRKAYFIDAERYLRRARLIELDAETGETRVLFEETSQTSLQFGFEFESTASIHPLPATEEVIWWSERSGWAHLYLYDLKTGVMKRPLTSGDWVVRDILHVDEKRREVYAHIAGRQKDRDPYFREVVRIQMDSGHMTVLLSGDFDTIVHRPGALSVYATISVDAPISPKGVAPSGDYFVATPTRADQTPQSFLYDRDGREILKLETADISGLRADWIWPELVKTKAADGETDIYSTLFRPSGFDAAKKYPLVDLAMTNSFYGVAPKGAFAANYLLGAMYKFASALAELGFIVIITDGRGTIYRSKSFHDHAYGRVDRGSELEDHIAAIQQLAEKFPYIDLSRVGIADWGGSNGPVRGLLQHGEFFKVGAVISLWDPRMIKQGEIYNGPEADFSASLPSDGAENLTGKLLLMHGLMDPYFPVSGYYQVVDALIQANKDFDMITLPKGRHSASTGYAVRQIWDHLVRHLRGETPPEGFVLKNASELASS